MWRDILAFALDIVEKIGDFATWLFQPIQYNSVFGEIIKNIWGIEAWFRPVDLIGISTLGVLIVLLLVHLANVFS